MFHLNCVFMPIYIVELFLQYIHIIHLLDKNISLADIPTLIVFYLLNR